MRFGSWKTRWRHVLSCGIGTLVSAMLLVSSKGAEPLSLPEQASSSEHALPILSWEELPGRHLPLLKVTDDQKDRRDASLLFGQGRLLAQRGELAAALQRYQRAYQFDRSAVIVREILPLALEVGRLEEATRYGKLVEPSQIENPVVAQRMALLLTDDQDYARAIQFYEHSLEQLVENDPQNVDARIVTQFELGRLHFVEGNFGRSATYFDKVWRVIDNPQSMGISKQISAALLNDPAVTFTLVAEAYFNAGRLPEAEAAYRRAATSPEPLNLALQEILPFQLAKIAFKSGEIQRARQLLANYFDQKGSAAGAEPYSLLLAISRATDEEVSEDPTTNPDTIPDATISEFSKTLATLLNRDPLNPALRQFVADWYRQHDRPTEARPLYVQLLADSPSVTVYASLVDVYRELGEYDELLDLLGSATSVMQSLEPLSEQVDKCVHDERTLARLGESAVLRLEQKAEEVSCHALAAISLLGIVAQDFTFSDKFFRPAFEAAARDINTGETTGPENTELFLNWGLGLFLNEQYARAANVFHTALTREQVSPELVAVFEYYLAGAWEMSGETEKALQMARYCAEHAPQMPSFELRPAWVLFHAKRTAEADDAYRDWLAKYESNYEVPGIRDAVRDARFVRSSLCSQAGQHDEAIEMLSRILDELPDDIAAQNDLAYMLAEHGGSLSRARRLIVNAVRAEPDNPAYRDTLGWILYQLDDFEASVTELRRAIADEEPDPIILDHLGDALLKVGKAEEARTAWQRALDLLTKSPDETLQASLTDKLRDNTRR